LGIDYSVLVIILFYRLFHFVRNLITTFFNVLSRTIFPLLHFPRVETRGYSHFAPSGQEQSRITATWNFLPAAGGET